MAIRYSNAAGIRNQGGGVTEHVAYSIPTSTLYKGTLTFDRKAISFIVKADARKGS